LLIFKLIYIGYLFHSCFIGLFNSIQKPEFIVVVYILNEVLSIINILSNKLQGKSATLGSSCIMIKNVISTFENLRNEKSFLNLWEQIKNFSQLHELTLELIDTS